METVIKSRFTLLELLLVVAIIGILVSTLMPSLANARKKAMVAVCLANHRQMITATQLFLKNNSVRFPYPKYSSKDPNTGRYWVGQAGTHSNCTVDVTGRPWNEYLGYTRNGVETPIAECPAAKGHVKFIKDVTNYIGAARTEYLDDLDNSNSSIFVDELNNTSTMNIIGETPGWHYANNPWKLGGQLHEPGKPVYSFSFIDEHAKNLKIYGDMGINSENETLNFRNF